ncbi:hypothetical protein E3W21_06040 [Pseudomonas sp. F01002]|nr:hypothetical protein E3W21_06040 [Pseudomonas sp. F01002]
MGASLLAMAICQSTSIVIASPSSRASSLPQGMCGVCTYSVSAPLLAFGQLFFRFGFCPGRWR